MSDFDYICPIMSAGLKANPEGSINDEAECEKIRCAWWNQSDKRCAVLSSSMNLSIVEGSINGIEARLSSIEDVLAKEK